jgi:trigger factor
MRMDSDMDQVLAGKTDLSYEIQLEVMPDFIPADPAGLSLVRPVYEASEDEVDEAVARLAEQRRTYEPKTGEDAVAEDGDMVVADFVGRIDGEPFDGGTAQDSQIVIGSGQFIPGFEEQLKGAKAGEARAVEVSFPEDYGVEALKGKAAQFEVTVKDVRAPVQGAIDDAFAETLGLGSLDALKQAVKAQMQQTYANQSRFKLKRALLDALDEAHDFPLPPRKVEAEFESIWRQVQADQAEGGLPEEDAAKSEEELQADYRKIAERRVRLGLVLAEVGRLYNVGITDEEMTAAARQEAMRYGAQAQEVFDYIRRTPQAQTQLRAPIYEDKVVDLIFRLAKVEDKPVSKDELMQDDDLPEGYGAGEQALEASPEAQASAEVQEPPAEAESVTAQASAEAETADSAE